MPGIIGIISGRPTAGCDLLVRKMVASMNYEDSYVCGTYSVPEMRLHGGWVANEGSFSASQPFLSETGDVELVLSGECFNDRQLQPVLTCNGHKLAKNRAHWLVRLYEDQDDRFFEKLNGLFSGLLIDKRQRKTFLFNDRYALERIYCYQNENATYFASEAKALLSVLPELREFDT